MVDLTKTLKDATYITIGLGVIGYQQTQVRLREFEARLSGRRQQLETQVTKLVKDLEDRFEPVRETVEENVDRLEGRLPAQAKDLVRQARTAAREAQAELRGRLSSFAA